MHIQYKYSKQGKRGNMENTNLIVRLDQIAKQLKRIADSLESGVSQDA